jgi:hypothetical protein
MWIVRTALDRPYTFIVMVLLILLATPIALRATPTDLLPDIRDPIKIFFQPHAHLQTAIAQMVSSPQSQLRQMPPGLAPPLVISYSPRQFP